YLPPGGSTATANGFIDRVVTTGNGHGIAIATSGGGGAATFAISNSVVANNGIGISINDGAATLTVSIDNTAISNNADGIDAFGSPSIVLGRSVITANSQDGVNNHTIANTFYTYGDNRINLNGTNINGTNGTQLNSTPILQ